MWGKASAPKRERSRPAVGEATLRVSTVSSAGVLSMSVAGFAEFPHLRGRAGLLFHRHADGSVTEVILLPCDGDLAEEHRLRVYSMVAELRRAA